MRFELPMSLVVLLGCSAAAAEDRILQLEIGEPSRRQRHVEVPLDTLVDTHSGDTLAPHALDERLGHARMVLVPEEHTSQDFHHVQLRVLEQLRAGGRPLAIGLEMFPAGDQALLDGWIGGEHTELGFVEHSDWYRRWGYRWDYYREIFLFARRHQIPMIALNAPQSVVGDVRAHGLERARETQALLSGLDIDTESEAHRQLFAAYFSEDDPVHGSLPEDQFERLFEAQCTWDAVMASNAAAFLEAHPQRTMVVLAGTGHGAFGLGIERQLPDWVRRATASIIAVPVNDDGTAMTVRASYGDVLWGVPPRSPPAFPVLDTVTSTTDQGLEILHMEPDSTAQRAGLQVGDVLTTFNGRRLEERADLNRELAALQWGDQVPVTVRRESEDLSLVLTFRRSL